MAAKQKTEKLPMPPLKLWLPAVALGWLVPGGGHFLLKRNGRGALILFSVASMFLFGIMMGGILFQPKTGGMLEMIIYCGGFWGTWPRAFSTSSPSGWGTPSRMSPEPCMTTARNSW